MKWLTSGAVMDQLLRLSQIGNKLRPGLAVSERDNMRPRTIKITVGHLLFNWPDLSIRKHG